MTDEEIKKALECCVAPKHDCSYCLLEKEVHCTSLLHKNILALINRQQAVIDDLKHEIRNLECEKGQLEGTIDFLVAEAKSEAIKEFAERLKEKVDPNWDNSVDVEDIDRLVVETVGEG